MNAPPVLTAERIDAMLSILAEVCLESVVEAGRRQRDAEDFETFERGGRALQRAGRNLRQTIALKQRFDRDQAQAADEGRRLAQAQRAEAERVRGQRVDQKRNALERHFERVLWDEYEETDAEGLLFDVFARVKHASCEDEFLETPVEALIGRIADEIGLAADDTPAPSPVRQDERAAEPDSTAQDAELSAETAEAPRLRAPPSATLAVEAGARGAHGGVPTGPTAPPPEIGPPEIARPPDPGPDPEPAPEPYVPPWDHLRAGERMPGGTGW